MNNDEHTHMDRSNDNTDLLDMAIMPPNLAKYDIQFQIGDDLGSDYLPIEVSFDAPPHRNSSTKGLVIKYGWGGGGGGGGGRSHQFSS